MLERRIDKTKKMLKGDKKYQKDIDLFERVLDALNEGKPARSVECDDDEKAILSEVALLTNKPVIYAANMSDEDFSNGIDSNEGYKAVQKLPPRNTPAFFQSVLRLRKKSLRWTRKKRKCSLPIWDLKKAVLTDLSRNVTHFSTYLLPYSRQTGGSCMDNQKRNKSTSGRGKIHSDFERGFIRAEVIAYDDLIACGSMTAAKEKGLVRSEGKDYVMKDGDVVLFRFNV